MKFMQRYNIANCRGALRGTAVKVANLRSVFIFCFLLLGAPAAAVAEPQVVASIKPVHSLVAGVMRGVGEPFLLVSGSATPHRFALRPSRARRLEAAAIVFWIGPALEGFLERPLRALARNAEVVSLLQADGMVRLNFREGGPWEGHDHEHGKDDAEAHDDPADEGHKDHAEPEHGHDHQAHHDDEQGHRSFDGHVWLDPRNAIAMTWAIARHLTEAYPSQAAQFEANAAAQVARLQDLDRELASAFARTSDAQYVVFHDAYQYLENRYGLRPVGSITVDPEVVPGAQRLSEIRRKIDESSAACVFAEPQFEPKLVNTVIEGTGARKAVLDPLGADLDDGPDLYFALLRRLADELGACLAGAS